MLYILEAINLPECWHQQKYKIFYVWISTFVDSYLTWHLLLIKNIFYELEETKYVSPFLSSKPVIDSGEKQTLVSYYSFPFQRIYRIFVPIIAQLLWPTSTTSRIQDQLYNFLTTFTCESWWLESKSCKDEAMTSFELP